MVNKYVDSGQQHMSEYVLHCKRKRKRGSGRTAPPTFLRRRVCRLHQQHSSFILSLLLSFFPSFRQQNEIGYSSHKATLCYLYAI